MLILPVCLLVACGQDVGAPDAADREPLPSAGPTDARPATRVAPGGATMATGPLLRVADRGGHLVDASGMALYYLVPKAAGAGCDAACQDVWPPVLSDAVPPAVAAGLQQALVGTVAAGDGQQVTYDGQPLYRYGGDQGVGTTSGDGVEDAWGTWHLMPAGGRDGSR